MWFYPETAKKLQKVGEFYFLLFLVLVILNIFLATTTAIAAVVSQPYKKNIYTHS